MCFQMASVSRLFSVYLLFIFIVNLTTATPRSLINHVVITESSLRSSPTTLTSIPLTVISKSKRARQSLGAWGEQYALPHGWSVTVSTMSMFMSFGSQAAADWFEDFYWFLQVACATQMLNDGPYLPRIIANHGPWRLALTMHSTSTVQQIEWSFVYYFAMYMRNWVLNGYTGTGALAFRHTSGIKLVALFVNMEDSFGPVVY